MVSGSVLPCATLVTMVGRTYAENRRVTAAREAWGAAVPVTGVVQLPIASDWSNSTSSILDVRESGHVDERVRPEATWVKMRSCLSEDVLPPLPDVGEHHPGPDHVGK